MVEDKYIKKIKIKEFSKRQSYKLLKEAIKKNCLSIHICKTKKEDDEDDDNNIEGDINSLKPVEDMEVDYCLCWGDGGGCDMDFDEVFEIIKLEYREPTLILYIDDIDYYKNIN